MLNAHPVVNIADRKIVVDIWQLAFATGISSWVGWYCWDAWHASSATANMILILPVSGAAIVLFFFVAAGCLKAVEGAVSRPELPRDLSTRASAVRVAGSMLLFVAFVVIGPVVGFDVACFAFLLAMLVFLGERRILVLLLFPLLFTVAVIFCFGTLLASPLPVMFLKGLNP